MFRKKSDERTPQLPHIDVDAIILMYLSTELKEMKE